MKTIILALLLMIPAIAKAESIPLGPTTIITASDVRDQIVDLQLKVSELERKNADLNTALTTTQGVVSKLNNDFNVLWEMFKKTYEPAIIPATSGG